MPKYVGKGTVTEHKGLARLKTFCANNVPFLICRDETILDVGIDGEIEVCLTNVAKKIEATGERIKFQLKSTESDNSYIQEETDSDFKFYARNNDVEYWDRHKQDVLLIIYDVRNDKLYGKKITLNDFKNQSQDKVRYPVTFVKTECLLSENNFDFHKKYSVSIKQRLNYDLKEPAMTNLFRVHFPKVLYSFETDFTKKGDVYKSLPENANIPEFTIYNKTLYTFVELRNQSEYFKQNIIKTRTEATIHFKNVLYDKDMRNHYVELIKAYFKKFAGGKGIHFNRDYHRFYFALRDGDSSRSILANTRKRGTESSKEVAKFYNYGTYKFYRHNAFSIDFIHAESMYLCITPTYFITTDRKTPADGKLASKFIIPQKSREFNPTVANSIHTIFAYLSHGAKEIAIANFDNIEIGLSSYIPLQLPFSITTDDKGFPEYLKRIRRKREKESVLELELNNE